MFNILKFVENFFFLRFEFFFYFRILFYFVFSLIFFIMMDSIDDIIENGLEAVDNVSNLVRQAITAATTHEKDKIIRELKRVWLIEQNAAEVVKQNNEEKLEMLEKLQQKEMAIKQEYDTFYTNTSFLYQLERSNPVPKTDLAKAIKKIEKSITPIKTLSSPNALNELMELPPEKDIFNLKTRDLLFTRLEELVYALKKRILIVEDSTNASISVIEQFGTVSGLINTHNELLEENQVLKEEESQYLNDAMAKRRNLTQISPSLLTNFSVVMQSELDALRTYGENLCVPMELNDDFPGFDTFCKVPNEIAFYKTDFGTNIDPELVEKIENSETPEEKLELLRQIMLEQMQSVDRLLNELTPLRKTTYCTQPDSKERLERLWALHDKFSAQILELTQNIENNNKEVRDLNFSILRTIKQRRYIEEQFCSILKMLLPLIDETTALSCVTNKNKTIMMSIAKICYNFALALINTKSDNFTQTKELLLSRIPPPPPVIKVVEPPPPPPVEEPEEEKNHLDDPRKFFMIKPTMPKKPKPRRTLTPADVQTIPKEEVVKERPNPIQGASPVELLDYMALAHDITMNVTPIEPLFHPTISGSLHDCLTQLRDAHKSGTDYFNGQMRNYIQILQRCSENILRVPKIDVETTVETCPRAEIELQTEEPEPPGKKGKKAPARSTKGSKPPRGKKSAR